MFKYFNSPDQDANQLFDYLGQRLLQQQADTGSVDPEMADEFERLRTLRNSWWWWGKPAAVKKGERAFITSS